MIKWYASLAFLFSAFFFLGCGSGPSRQTYVQAVGCDTRGSDFDYCTDYIGQRYRGKNLLNICTEGAIIEACPKRNVESRCTFYPQTAQEAIIFYYVSPQSAPAISASSCELAGGHWALGKIP